MWGGSELSIYTVAFCHLVTKRVPLAATGATVELPVLPSSGDGTLILF